MKEKIKKLREETGAGVMECKKAIEKSKGDFDGALKIIFESGMARAEKKKERKTGAGLLHSYIHNDKVGAIIDVRCETDFVVKSDAFRELVHDIAMHIVAVDPADVSELLKQPYIKDPSITVEELVKQGVSKIGENIKIERFTRYEI